MIDDEFDDEGDDFDDEPDLEEALDDDLLDDDLGDDLLEDDLADDVDDEGATVVVKAKPVTEAGEEDEDDDVVDLDEELHPDDVEEALDVVLRERTAAVGLDEDEEEEDEVDDRGEGTKIVPRRPGEFLCASCFLVLPRNQLADKKKSLCHDCA